MSLFTCLQGNTEYKNMPYFWKIRSIIKNSRGHDARQCFNPKKSHTINVSTSLWKVNKNHCHHVMPIYKIPTISINNVNFSYDVNNLICDYVIPFTEYARLFIIKPSSGDTMWYFLERLSSSLGGRDGKPSHGPDPSRATGNATTIQCTLLILSLIATRNTYREKHRATGRLFNRFRFAIHCISQVLSSFHLLYCLNFSLWSLDI